MKQSSRAVQRIKEKLSEFFGVLEREHKCSDADKRCRFITKNLLYCDRISGYLPRKKLQRILDAVGLKYLGSGGSRLVVGYLGFAIKLEKYDEDCGEDLSANECELAAYREIIKDPIKKLLVAPILSHFYMGMSLVLVYPLLDSYEELFADEKKSYLLENEYNKARETACNWLFADSGSNNFGLYKNELFYLDYNIESLDEVADPTNYHYTEVMQKDFADAINGFTMMKEEIRRTKTYIKEMRALA